MAQDVDRGLLLRCAMCRRLFSTSLTMSTTSFRGADIGTRSYQCPHCGFVTAYTKGDYHFDGEELQ